MDTIVGDLSKSLRIGSKLRQLFPIPSPMALIAIPTNWARDQTRHFNVPRIRLSPHIHNPLTAPSTKNMINP